MRRNLVTLKGIISETISAERKRMLESKNRNGEISELQKRHDAFCYAVIRKQAIKQIQRYVQYCKKYTAISIEEMEEELFIEEDIALEKFVFTVKGEPIVIEDEFLAEAIMELQERVRNVLLLNVALEHKLSEITDILEIGYDTAKVYKSMALHEIRKKVSGKNERT